jgi:hypothetical protein
MATKDKGGRVFLVEGGVVFRAVRKDAWDISERCCGCHLFLDCRGEEHRMDACYDGFNGQWGNRILRRVSAVS